MRWLLIAIALVALLMLGWWVSRTPEGPVVPSLPGSSQMVTTATATVLKPSPIAIAPRKPTPTNVIARATWGSGEKQLGRRHDAEGSNDGPMSLTVDGRGNLYVLDEVNRRVQKYSRSGVSSIAIGGEAVQDLAITKNGIALLDRLGEKNLQLYSPDGKMLGEVALEGKGIPESGGTTGLFPDRDGNLWVEREHQQLVRVALANGNSDPDRPTAPGRPSRDGSDFLSAAIADRAVGTALVRALDLDGNVLWQQLVSLGAPILHLTLVDSDAFGNVYLAGHTGRGSAAPPYSIVDEKLVIISLSHDGSPRGMMALDAAPPATESFRELAIGDDGTIYRMVSSDSGVTIETYRF
jgi:hypothetical protein